MKRPSSTGCMLSIAFLAHFAIIAATVSSARAGEHRHHDAHVHGVAHLNAAVEGASLLLEFSSPAANMVGFEHHPRTPKEKNAVHEAIETLKAGERLFVPSPGAQCRLTETVVETDIEHDEDHDTDAGHGHEGDAHEGDAHHTEQSDHHHADEHKADRHSEFTAVYRFACQKPEKLSKIDVMMFRAYPGIEHIETQFLTGTKQGGVELTARRNSISF